MNSRKLCIIAWLIGLFGTAWAVAAADVAPPPNRPAEVAWKPTGEFCLRYHGDTIFDGAVWLRRGAEERRAAAGEIRLVPANLAGQGVEQRLRIEPAEWQHGLELVLRGTVTGSDEAFAAETLSAAQKRFPCIRNSVGASRSLRNNAFYDRKWDWVLVGPGDGRTRLAPLAFGAGRVTFSWESRGGEIDLVFRPLFYQKHKNLKYFQPWTYKVWRGSVTGWSSWWAYQDSFSQKDLDATVEVFAAKNLPEYGYRYLQIDDCFQTGRGWPETWLRWNRKFPGGAEYAVRKIRSGGMSPAIWVGVNICDEKLVREHPDWFVRDRAGRPVRAPWVDFVVDATNPEALDKLVRPTYRGFKRLGFDYVKVDALRHLLYDGYHNRLDYLAKRNSEPAEVFRKYLGAIREEIGPDTYLLSCWGVLPEGIGIADGCRLGGDGFGPATLQQYNSWNGVVWRNDPDHCDILPGGKRPAGVKAPPVTLQRPCLVSMAGAMLLLSDRPPVYADDANLVGVKRSGPILDTVPGQLYDFQLAKSDNVVKIERTAVKAGGQMSPIDADQQGALCPWWLLEIDRPFEHWTVLAHFNWQSGEVAPARVSFAELGLSADRPQLVYEFWSKRFSTAQRSFTAPALAPQGVQVFAIREALDRPQVISTSRHISQGGVDLEDVQWDRPSRTLRGRSKVVRQDEYELAIRVTAGYALAGAEIDGSPASAARTSQDVIVVSYLPRATGTITWSVRFK